jgi:hypothetical protein
VPADACTKLIEPMAEAPSKEVASSRIGEIRDGLKLLAGYL